MPLQLAPIELGDMNRAAEIERAAYSDNKFTPILFPGPFPPGVLDTRGKELAQMFQEDPTGQWWKVIDTDLEKSDQMIPFAKWNIWDPQPEAKPSRGFGAGCNVEACEALFGGLLKMRQRLLEGQSSVCE